jgi:ferredoxin
MSRLEIDAARCTGHGRCYSLVPGLFDADEYGHGQLVESAEIDPDQARKAVWNCPEQAIRFEP